MTAEHTESTHLTHHTTNIYSLSTLSIIQLGIITLLGVVLWRTHGHYSPALIVCYALCILMFFMLSFRNNLYESQNDEPSLYPLLFAISCVFLILNLIHPGPIYLPNKQWLYCLIALSLFSLFAVAAVACQFNQAKSWLFIGTILLLLIRKYIIIFAVPVPHIDVFTTSTAAVNHLLNFVNPYGAHYIDIYNGRMGYLPDYSRLPMTLYSHTIGKVLFNDIRYSYLFYDIAIMLSFISIAKINHRKQSTALPFIIVYLCFPVQIFLLEQAWNEPILMAFIIWAFVGLLKKNILLTAI